MQPLGGCFPFTPWVPGIRGLGAKPLSCRIFSPVSCLPLGVILILRG